jgi:hypothetical protein
MRSGVSDSCAGINRRALMLDIVFIAGIVAFFVAGGLLVRACDRI